MEKQAELTSFGLSRSIRLAAGAVTRMEQDHITGLTRALVIQAVREALNTRMWVHFNVKLDLVRINEEPKIFQATVTVTLQEGI